MTDHTLSPAQLGGLAEAAAIVAKVAAALEGVAGLAQETDPREITRALNLFSGVLHETAAAIDATATACQGQVPDAAFQRWALKVRMAKGERRHA